VTTFVAGATTMIGRALVRRLGADAGVRLVGTGRDEPDLHDPAALDRFLATARPEQVLLVAGRHAGIGGNRKFPADLMLDNLQIAANVIPAAHRHGVTTLLYLASSCTYPKLAPQPFRPDSLWTGPVEPTSAAYAVAKLAGMTLADAYRRQHGVRFLTAIAADAYGPGDDFSPDNSHVVGALIRRMHDARIEARPSVEIWGSGRPRREFIYVDDLADACVFALRHATGDEPVNLGTGVTTSIAELADAVRTAVGYQGELTFDSSRPDGMPLKGLDSSILRARGWTPRWTLQAGLTETVRWFVEHAAQDPAVRG
jgi:GDP-L-fucose synthase